MRTKSAEISDYQPISGLRPDNQAPLDNQNYQFDNRENIVTWEIQNPRLNHVYRIDWDW
jgi:hypothetical protein